MLWLEFLISQALQREFGFGSRDLKHMDVNELAVGLLHLCVDFARL